MTAPLNSYSTGTVSVSADGTTITGTSTLWLDTGNVKPGDLFQSGHFLAQITDVTDDTHMVITPWPGSTLSGADYVVWKVSQQRIVGATYAQSVSDLVGALDTSGFFVFVNINQTVPDPSLGNEGQYAFQPTTGKTWVKTGGAWSYLGIFKAFQFKGAWSGATAYLVGDVVTLSGSSYVCVLDHTNQTPPNTTYWQLLASKGDTGSTGATGAGYGGTSTTSRTIGTGLQSFDTQAGLAYSAGARVRATSAANTSNWMEGIVTVYNVLGSPLTINVDKTNGSGTLADWNFNVVGQPGAGDLSSANNLSELTATAATARSNLGVKQGMALAASQDFNAVTTAGTYHTVDGASANAPVTAEYWYLFVEQFNPTTYVKQTATRVNLPGESYIRTCVAGTWGSWKQVLSGVGHIPGIASNAAASAGEIGEVISASGTSGSLTSGVTTNLGSIPLGAGDWDITATIQFNASGGTTITDYNAAISASTASLTPYGTSLAFTQRVPAAADHSEYFAFPPVQALINATTSFYLNARSVFTGTAPTATWSLRARRMR